MKAKHIVCYFVSVHKNALLNYNHILWLWLKRFKQGRICPRGRRGRRIAIWQQLLPCGDHLPFTRPCTATGARLTAELPGEACDEAHGDDGPHRPPGPKAGLPPHQTGEQMGVTALICKGFLYNPSSARRGQEGPRPRMCQWQKAARGFESLSPSLHASFPALPFQVVLVLRKQLQLHVFPSSRLS